MGPGLKNVRGAGAADVAMTCTTLEKDVVIVSSPSPLEDTDQCSLVKARRHKSCQSAPAVELSLTGVTTATLTSFVKFELCWGADKQQPTKTGNRKCNVEQRHESWMAAQLNQLIFNQTLEENLRQDHKHLIDL